MSYGIDISTSGVLTSLHRQDVLTSNLANLNTVGYKPLIPDVKQRDVARLEDNVLHLPSDRLLEKLGAGVVPAASRIGFGQGPIDQTGNDLDVAIEGDGFLAVRDGDATSLTRDGRLTLNSDGHLALASSGHLVLGASGPISIPRGARVAIAHDGTISANGAPIDTLRLVDVPDRQRLVKKGDGLFDTGNLAAAALTPGSGRIIQGAVEGSAVSEIEMMMQVQSAAKAVGSNIGVISYHDRMIERAINTFARTG
ncbi:MAG: flagellar hook basal-body protein [Phycisphaerales bacterium]